MDPVDLPFPRRCPDHHRGEKHQRLFVLQLLEELIGGFPASNPCGLPAQNLRFLGRPGDRKGLQLLYRRRGELSSQSLRALRLQSLNIAALDLIIGPQGLIDALLIRERRGAPCQHQQHKRQYEPHGLPPDSQSRHDQSCRKPRLRRGRPPRISSRQRHRHRWRRPAHPRRPASRPDARRRPPSRPRRSGRR